MKVTVHKYVKALSGDAARLCIQLIYFYLVANTLTIAEFGLFATASAVGIVLSRLVGFGFISPLYRVATVKPKLIGVYTGGLLAIGLLSLPLVAMIGWGIYALFFAETMVLAVFALIVAAEVLFWRGFETVLIVIKGLEWFGRASVLIVFGFSMKALAAVLFAFGPFAGLHDWAIIYFCTQLAMCVIVVAAFYPRQRLRLRPRLYMRRMKDALSVCGADMLFYARMELDKLVVLSLAGEVAAGLYAMVMRLVDLTATPVRVFSTILSQRLMRTPQMLRSVKTRVLLELGVVFVSLSGLAAMAIAFWIKPDLLGANVAQAGPLMIVVACVPAFRNLIEYHAELLYGRGQTGLRLINYTLIGALKAVLFVWILTTFQAPDHWFVWINAAYAALYCASFILTYTALRRPGIRV